MGNVNVVINGEVKSVPAEDADRLTGMGVARRQTDQEAVGQATAAENVATSSGVGQGGLAAAEGLLDTITGGGFGAIATEVAPDYAENMRNRGQNRPGERLVGDVLGYATGAGVVGGATKAGARVAASTGSKTAGRVVTGGILGATANVAASNVSGDPLTVAGTMEAVGIGAFLDAGIGALGDKLLGFGNRAKAAVAHEAEVAEVKAKAKGVELLRDNKGYTHFKAAHDDVVRSVQKHNARVTAAARKRDAVVTDTGIRKGVDQLKKARLAVQAEAQATPYGRQVAKAQRAHRAAERAHGEAAEAYDAFIADPNAINLAYRQVDDVIEGLSKRPGGDLTDDLAAMKAGADAGEDVLKTPGKPPMAARLKEFRNRRSAASSNPDPHAGAAELKALRDDIESQFPTGPEIRGKRGKSALPDVPTRPGEKPVYAEPVHTSSDPSVVQGELAEMEALKKISKDLERTANDATILSREGRYDDAADLMEAAKIRATEMGFGDLEFPRFPPRPSAPLPVPHATLPDSLEDFARKTSQVDELADAIEAMPEGVHDSFRAMARELDLLDPAAVESIGETVRRVHRATREYPAAYDRLQSLQSAAGRRGKSFWDKTKEFAERGIRTSVGRYVDTGGTAGAMKRAMAMGAAGGLMMQFDPGTAALGAALLSGRHTIKSKLTGMVARLAPGAGRGLQKLAPVTAYLANTYPSGVPDKDPDVRNQAHNRIGDVFNAAMTAPDASYTAIESLLGAPGDVAFKMHAHVVNAINHLAQMAPKDPGVDVTMSGSNWRPSAAQTIEFAHRIEAVEDPLAAVERSIQGGGHPAAAETLWAVWPALMEEFASEFLMAGPQKMGREAEARLARLLRVPTGLNNPLVLATLQGQHLPKPTQPASGSTGGSPGRPTATGQVAGSSVSALIG